MSAARPERIPLDAHEQRALAVALFNYTWTLLEKDDRTDRERELMVAAAHASRLLWEEPGEPVNHARGEWQLARVYAVAGRAEPALHHARLCLELCEAHGIGDFDLAFAHEAVARAHAVAGDTAAAAEHERLARHAADAISDPDDREHLLADLATLPRHASSGDSTSTA